MKAAGKGETMGGSSMGDPHAWVTEQITAVLKELASNRGAQCEAHLAPGKPGKKAEASICLSVAWLWDPNLT